jgi:hypothetical protein
MTVKNALVALTLLGGSWILRNGRTPQEIMQSKIKGNTPSSQHFINKYENMTENTDTDKRPCVGRHVGVVQE